MFSLSLVESFSNGLRKDVPSHLFLMSEEIKFYFLDSFLRKKSPGEPKQREYKQRLQLS